MDLFNTNVFNPYDLPPDMTEAEARDILRGHYEANLSIPYGTAKELFALAHWNMNGSWIPISYVGLSLEQAVRKAQLKNIVYDQDLIYIVTSSEDTTIITAALLERYE